MGNKRVFVTLGIFGALLVSSAVYAADYWTGDGGRGMSLVIMEPKSNNLPSEQQYFTSLVQGYFVTTLSTYSAIAVQDRMHAEDVMRQAELQNESGVQDIGKILEVNHVLTGSITKTSTAFALTIQIIRVSGNSTAASHSANYTLQEIEDKTAVNKASLDLLGKMGVTLTTLAKTQLQQAASRQDIQGQTALAQGIEAQRKGDEIRATALYNQAWAIDPSRMEAANRVSIVSASIRTGNIGNDRRNDIQWRNDWRARLEETERYFDTFFKTFNQPYALVWTNAPQYGDTNYRDETVPVSYTVELLEQSNWTDPVMKTVNTVWQGLNATGKKAAWGFEDWPRSSVSNVYPFGDGNKRFTIAVELVNDQKKVVARQTFEVRGRWEFSFNLDSWGIRSFTSSGQAAQTVRFTVKAGDLPDNDGSLTLNFTTVNGAPAADASKNGVLMITTRSEYRNLAGFDLAGYDRDGYNRNGYNSSGYNRAGYNAAGYDRDGYNRAGYTAAGFGRDGYDQAGYNQAGYDRSGFNRNGFDRKGLTADGSRYDTAGFDRYGYDRDGYNAKGYDQNGYNKRGRDREGYNKSGYKRWSPVSSVLECLYTFHTGFGNGAAHGFTFGLLGLYSSFSYDKAVSEKLVYDSSTGNEETETTTDLSLGEFVVGYTLNVMPTKKGRVWGLGVSLGAGRNNLENQLVMETGLQFRVTRLEIRGAYRTVGFKDSSFTMSVGWCFGLEIRQHSRYTGKTARRD
jgi:TolB-like protein